MFFSNNGLQCLKRFCYLVPKTNPAEIGLNVVRFYFALGRYTDLEVKFIANKKAKTF